MISDLSDLAPAADHVQDGKRRLGWAVFDTGSGIEVSPALQYLIRVVKEDAAVALDGFDYLNPDGLIRLLTAADWLLQKSRRPLMVALPRVGKALASLVEYRFPWTQIRLPQQSMSLLNMSYLKDTGEPAESFDTILPLCPRTIRWVTDKAVSFMNNQMLRLLSMTPHGGARDKSSAFIGTIVQIVSNVVRHSQLTPWTGTGYATMSAMPYGAVEFVCGDSGIGLRKRLWLMGRKYGTDEAALRAAILLHSEDAVRPTPGEPAVQLGSAEGLYDVATYIARWHGKLRLRTFGAEGILDLSKLPAEDAIRPREEVGFWTSVINDELDVIRRPRFPGVHVKIEMKTPDYVSFDVMKDILRAS
ncbi:MAG: hypothetical protein JXA57_14550 [Armatimonadetes bacterium]|nr:hypothetical protein [Armatimonadota bacterium]